ncbi:hypothetical protein G4B88_015245 [Cannabis sativa]|uniref:Uncharacterized protein n=1 Tax=Cannabis sativa TaxID=3483 RepID=A0A7J6HBJ1_CANSA|nr:hypothetical protein G4B88_015245 [Cannabis sativa]
MEDALRESKPYTDRLFSRARRVWSWILSWVLCGPRRRTRMEVTIVVVVSSGGFDSGDVVRVGGGGSHQLWWMVMVSSTGMAARELGQ